MSNFPGEWRALQRDVHEMAREKGWWDEERNDGEVLMLVVSELAETCEALRRGNPPAEHIAASGFSHVEEELADVVIRLMDWAEARGYDVGGAVLAKVAFNATRERKHGKRF